MSSIGSYRDLKVWQDAMQLAEVSYRLTTKLPKDELYGLSTQIKRASVSIPANIAEGYGRGVTGSYLQFLRIARGSLRELETHFLLAGRLGLVAPTEIEPIIAKCDTVGRMLHSLISSVQKSEQGD